MTERTRKRRVQPDIILEIENNGSPEEPLPTTNDPGGAHTKGYSADPRPEAKVQDQGPIPLAAGHDGASAVRQPERDGKVRPTGRSEGRGYSPNDRLMGSDR
jgi:hypothetical protein